MRLDEAIDEQRFKCTRYMRDLVIAAAASVRGVLEAVQEAMQRYGKPEIFSTDQCSQFTSIEFTRLLKDNGIAISMDDKGCWRDNVFMERLWKSIK